MASARDCPPVLCIGAIVQDTLARSHSPLQVGDDLPGHTQTRLGGVATNIALALAAYGVDTALLGAVGQDAIAIRLLSTLEEAGIDSSRVMQLPGSSDHVVTLENPNGERFGAVAECGQLSAITRDHVDRVVTTVSEWQGTVLIDGNLGQEEIAALLQHHTAGVTVVPASPEKAAHLADIIRTYQTVVVANLAEAECILGCEQPNAEAAAMALSEHGAREAAVTDGNQDAALAWDGKVITRTPPAVEVVSTTGAGDAFVAGLLAASGKSPEERLAAAVTAASRHLSSQTVAQRNR